MISNAKIAIVLFNLGVPDCLESVRPFLYNLFSDPQIIGLPSPFRQIIAKWIAWRRHRFSQENYRLIGGYSPLLENTQAQAEALHQALKEDFPQARVFIAMRYWHPLTDETYAEVQHFEPDEIVLLPLYPHYSTTTTESSLRAWRACSSPSTKAVHPICCWWNEEEYIASHVDLLKKEMGHYADERDYHVLFSAHGVPQRVIDRGDPYERQIEDSARLIAESADLPRDRWSLAYQSRVGPVKWLGPETSSEIVRLGQEENISTLFLVPLSFVSEHVETLVELDIEFLPFVREANLKHYRRIPTLDCHPLLISCWRSLIIKSLTSEALLCPDEEPCSEVY